MADRLDRRRLLLITQSVLMLLAFVLGSLTLTGVIQVWMIVVLAFGSGATLSFDQPARYSLIPELAPPADLMNALSLQAAVFNGAAALGPVIAGIAIPRIGFAGNFFANAFSYLAVLASLFLLPRRIGSEHKDAAGKLPLWQSIAQALSLIRADAVLPGVLITYGVLLFAGPSPALLLPVFSEGVLHLNPPQLGLLFSAVGFGTVFGALLVASLGDFPRKGLLMLTALGVWALALAAFASSRDFTQAIAALTILGAAQNAVGATAVTLMQTRVPANMRGRVMSLNTLLIMAVRPLGDFPSGLLIAAFGVRTAALAVAAIVGIYSAAATLWRPAVRRA